MMTSSEWIQKIVLSAQSHSGKDWAMSIKTQFNFIYKALFKTRVKIKVPNNVKPKHKKANIAIKYIKIDRRKKVAQLEIQK